MVIIRFRNKFLALFVLGIICCYGCKKTNQPNLTTHIVIPDLTPFAGQYKVSGFYGETGMIASRIDTLPGDTTTQIIDTTIAYYTYNDTIITVSVTNDTTLTIWGSECYYSTGGGPPSYFHTTSDFMYSQDVTITSSSPDSIYINIYRHLNPASALIYVLKGVKL